MKNRFWIIIWFFLVHPGVYAQRKALDSRDAAVVSVQDTAEVNKLQDVCMKARYTQKYDSALYYAQKSLSISAQLHYTRGITMSYYTIGLICQDKWELEKSLLFFKKALETNDPKNLKRTGRIKGAIAESYRCQSNYPKALEGFLDAMIYAEKSHDSLLMMTCCCNMGDIYQVRHDYNMAVSCLQRSIALAKLIHREERTGPVLDNLASVYSEQGDDKKAFDYYRQAILLEHSVGDRYGEAIAYSNMGSLQSRRGMLAEAVANQQKALNIMDSIGHQGGVIDVMTHLGYSYNTLKNHKLAIRYAVRANELAREHHFIMKLKESERLLNDIYKSQKNYEKAYEHFRNYAALEDSISNDENTKKMLETEMSYEFEKKASAARELQLKKDAEAEAMRRKQKVIIWVVSGSLLLLSVIAFLVIRQFRFKNREREMQLEQKLLRSQMNPHFIFNSLQAIQNFVLKHRDTEAVRYLGSFAAITRSVLENSRLEMIPLRKEAALLGNYLQLQKLRFGEKFDYEVLVDEALDQDEVYIPPMLSQPFIENALEHGMGGIERGGLIRVEFSRQDNWLVLEITDNGYGLRTEKKEHKEHTSLATTITRERIALMNRKNPSSIRFSIAEAYPGTERVGVKVRFEMLLQAN